MSSETDKKIQQENSIIPNLINGTLLPILIHPPFAFVIGYIVKKRWIISYIFPSIKPYFNQANIPFAVVGAFVAFMWILMTSWTIMTRIGEGRYNINSPRISQKSVTGARERLQSAYENTLEQFPAFAAGVIIAHLTKVSIAVRTSLTILYLIFRAIWFIAYIGNYPKIRALCFVLANWAMFYLYLFATVNNFDYYFDLVFGK